jgi:hypothetical protein
MAAKGFPELKQLYTMLGSADNVMLHRGEHFPHNYNAVSRSAFCTWLNRHFELGFPEPVIERDYDPLSRDELSVWDAEHPAPKATGEEFERKLLDWFADDAEKQLCAAAASPESLRKVVGSAVEVLIGRTIASAGKAEWRVKDKQDHGDFVARTGLVRNKTHREELPVAWLYPKEKWNRSVVVWLDDSGKAALHDSDGSLRPEVSQLIDAGTAVLGADLVFQGEFLADGEPVKQTRVVENPREAPAYTFGYNHTVFAQRTHDVLTLVAFLRDAKLESHPAPSSIVVAGFGSTGPIVAAARAVAGDAIDVAVVDTGGFRFGNLLDYRDPQFLPGGAKYLDLPGLLALSAPHPLWLAGEGMGPTLVFDTYIAAGAKDKLTGFSAKANETEQAAVGWLIEKMAHQRQ